jgi:4-hydroxy-3-polyprenylbenzoate decarboxylase
MITRDPASGEVRFASYAVALKDHYTMTACVDAGCIDPVWQKYWAGGKPCPVAISLGQDPRLLAVALSGTPPGASGYDFAGWIRGAAVETTAGEFTGLPIPATAEVVLEGEITPPETQATSALLDDIAARQPQNALPRPTITIHGIYFRSEPIIIGNPPFTGTTHGVLASGAAFLWNELERSNIANITAINHRPWGVIIVAINQLDSAHVQRLAHALVESSAGHNLKFAIIVDEDIDPYNLEKVFWAVATRYEPEFALKIVRRLNSDSAPGEDGRSAAIQGDAAAIIDACRPYRWKDKFPRTTDISAELTRKTIAKWGKILEPRS